MKDKYKAVVDWWNELLNIHFPTPKKVPSSVVEPYFVTEAKNKLYKKEE